MEQSKIDRINFLAKKSKEEGLTEAEKAEQKELREEYLSAIRKNLRATLDNVEIVDKKTGVLESDINYNVKDEFINSDYGKDSFNTVYNAWEEVHKQMNKTDIKSITDTYKV